MGNVYNRLRGKVAFANEEEKGEAVGKDSRRRNSLAYNISQFVNFEGSDFSILIDEIKKENANKSKDKEKMKAKGNRFTKIAEDILSGNMREIKSQVAVSFQFINRKYKDFHENAILHFVCQEGYAEMLEFVDNPHNRSEFEITEIEYNIKNIKGRTPLHVCFTPPTATFQGQKFGVSPDGIPLAVKPDEIDVALDWIKPGGPRSRERCIKLLIKNEVNVNEKDFHDFTSLHFACMWGWTSTVKLLMQAGADPNAKNTVGRTPFMYCVEFMHDHLAELLAYDKRVQINASDVEGMTALMIATELGTPAIDILERLLVAGADTEAETTKKKCALSIACKAQCIEAVHILLNHNCKRRPEALSLLTGDALKDIQARIKKEEAEAKAQEEASLKKLEDESASVNQKGSGYRTRSPWGAWVEYTDKRGGGSFFYNPVTRKSQWTKPKDFKPDKKKGVKSATYGMNFYH